MSDASFQPGDVVQLKSGGPLITVVALTNDKLKFTYYYMNDKGLISEHNTLVLAAAFKKVDPPTEQYTGVLPLGSGPS
jgi:hypothetical protein